MFKRNPNFLLIGSIFVSVMFLVGLTSCQSSGGVIADPETGLEWVVGPDQNMDYSQAVQWVSECNTAGGGWRMPTWQELKPLYDRGVGTRNMEPAFKTTGWNVWAQPKGSVTAWVFDFGASAREVEMPRNHSVGSRAFGVRSHPQG